jgi:hypothetical protein
MHIIETMEKAIVKRMGILLPRMEIDPDPGVCTARLPKAG